MGTDDDWPVARSDPQRKEENFTRPRGLGGKRPQRPSCRWNHPQGIPAESAFFGCTFGARTKGWRYYCTLRVPAVIGLLAKGIFGNNSRNEGKYFVFFLFEKNCSIQRRQKGNKKIRQASLSNKCGALANSMGRSSAPSSGSG